LNNPSICNPFLSDDPENRPWDEIKIDLELEIVQVAEAEMVMA
jgi:hypothetical protein